MLDGPNRRLVSAARTRAMVAHGLPEHPITVIAANAFNNDTDAVERYIFCLLLTALSAGIGAAP